MIRPERIARVDLGAVSERDARKALAAAAQTVRVELHAVRAAIAHLDCIDMDDMRSIAQIAVIEAFATWLPDRGAQLATWTQRLVRWRLRETIQASQRHDHAIAVEDIDQLGGSDVDQSGLSSASVAQVIFAARVQEAFAEAYRNLAPETRLLVEAAVLGRTCADVSRMTARSYSQVCCQTALAMGAIRRAVGAAAGMSPP